MAERMTKQSGMIAFAEQFAQAKVDAAQRLTSQYMIDTLQRQAGVKAVPRSVSRAAESDIWEAT